MPHQPPYDRTTALGCSMPTLRSRYLTVRCKCGRTTPHPVGLLLINGAVRPDQTQADAVVNMRCVSNGCPRAGLTLYLCETGYAPDSPNLIPAECLPGGRSCCMSGVEEAAR